MDIKTVLVVGATGNVGRHVAAGLRDAGITVRALSRNPSLDRLPAGVDAVTGDLAHPDSVRAAAAGADAAFLLWPFITAERADAAVRAIAAQSIERSGAEWTFLRAGGFAANTLAWAERIRSDGVVRWAYGEAARSLIHERDIADVAVRALTEDGARWREICAQRRSPALRPGPSATGLATTPATSGREHRPRTPAPR